MKYLSKIWHPSSDMWNQESLSFYVNLQQKVSFFLALKHLENFERNSML